MSPVRVRGISPTKTFVRNPPQRCGKTYLHVSLVAVGLRKDEKPLSLNLEGVDAQDDPHGISPRVHAYRIQRPGYRTIKRRGVIEVLAPHPTYRATPVYIADAGTRVISHDLPPSPVPRTHVQCAMTEPSSRAPQTEAGIPCFRAEIS